MLNFIFENIMKLRSFLMLILSASIFISACHKKEPLSDPCSDVLSESPPIRIMVKFIDKTTKENLILANGIMDTDISVTYKQTGQAVKNWRVYRGQGGPVPIDGMLEFVIFNEMPGQHDYEIVLGSVATAMMSYTVTKVKSENPCRPYYFPINGIKISDHPFMPFEEGGKIYPNILVTEL